MARTKAGPQVTIGFRVPQEIAEAIEKDRLRLDLDQSEWMRLAVARGLAAKFTPTQAERFRRRRPEPVPAAGA